MISYVPSTQSVLSVSAKVSIEQKLSIYMHVHDFQIESNLDKICQSVPLRAGARNKAGPQIFLHMVRQNVNSRCFSNWNMTRIYFPRQKLIFGGIEWKMQYTMLCVNPHLCHFFRIYRQIECSSIFVDLVILSYTIQQSSCTERQNAQTMKTTPCSIFGAGANLLCNFGRFMVILGVFMLILGVFWC